MVDYPARGSRPWDEDLKAYIDASQGATFTDTSVAQQILNGGETQDALNDVVPDMVTTALDATTKFARSAGPLGGWLSVLAVAPSTAKVVLLGDSTSDPVTQSSVILRRWLGLHSQRGEALAGLGGADYYTDGVSTGTATFTSASAAFTASDKGRFFHGKGVPAATTIANVVSATEVTLSNNITAGTNLFFWVGRSVIGGGNNGMRLGYWLANPNFTAPNGRYNQNQLKADNPHLTVASWLINDIREGGLGTTLAACVANGTALLQQFVDWHRANLPNTDLLLRMPNSFLSANTGGLNFVSDGAGNVNPPGLAQIYSQAIRQIYLSFRGRYPNVDVYDAQAEVFGTSSLTTSTEMIDQLHPSPATTSDLDLRVPLGGGYVNLSDGLAEHIGFAPNAFPAATARRFKHDFVCYSTPGSSQIQLMSRDYTFPASQTAVAIGDSLYVNGFDSPTTITDINRVVDTNQLLLTVSGTVDFTGARGRSVAVMGSHAGSGAVERKQLIVNRPAVAGAVNGVPGEVGFTVTVPGVRPGNVGGAVGAVFAPGQDFTGRTSLRVYQAYPSATDTMYVRLGNSSETGTPPSTETWTYWLLR